MRLTFSMPLLVFALMLPTGISGCHDSAPQAQTQTVPSPINSTMSIAASPIAQANAPTPTVDTALLQQSWAAYRQRFIQADGRVIDWESDARSTSEGQAYAMLRSVMIDDPQTFARTLTWAETNLRRGEPSDIQTRHIFPITVIRKRRAFFPFQSWPCTDKLFRCLRPARMRLIRINICLKIVLV